MKRWLLAFGCLFFGVGVFYDFLPIEVHGGISQIFSSQSTHMYFRAVHTEYPDLVPIAFVVTGVALIIAGLFMRRAKSHS